MRVMDLKEMKQRVVPMVELCIKKYGGGEKYFDNLDDLIKHDSDLLCSFTQFALKQSKTQTIIAGGEIGNYLREVVPRNVNLICVSGGLRLGVELEPLECDNAIFIDDSFYSGTTYRKVKTASRGKVNEAYVFYDGSPVRDKEVFSLYRYYK